MPYEGYGSCWVVLLSVVCGSYGGYWLLLSGWLLPVVTMVVGLLAVIVGSEL